jgi:hypothetical protein
MRISLDSLTGPVDLKSASRRGLPLLRASPASELGNDLVTERINHTDDEMLMN